MAVDSRGTASMPNHAGEHVQFLDEPQARLAGLPEPSGSSKPNPAKIMRAPHPGPSPTGVCEQIVAVALVYLLGVCRAQAPRPNLGGLPPSRHLGLGAIAPQTTRILRVGFWERQPSNPVDLGGRSPQD